MKSHVDPESIPPNKDTSSPMSPSLAPGPAFTPLFLQGRGSRSPGQAPLPLTCELHGSSWGQWPFSFEAGFCVLPSLTTERSFLWFPSAIELKMWAPGFSFAQLSFYAQSHLMSLKKGKN